MTHVRLWEGQCAAGRTDGAVAWVQQRVAAEALEAGAHTAEVFRSDDRVALLTRWPAWTPWVEPVPDPTLVVECRARTWVAVGDR